MKTDNKQALRDKQNEKYKKYWLGLKLSPELRNRLYVYVDRAGNPETLWKMSRDGLVAIGLKNDIAESFIAFRSSIDLEKEQERLQDAGISLITDCDPEYPQQLKISPWHPKAIFYKGKPKQYEKGVAIVGSRKATGHGKNTAYELAHDLAKAGVAVISGGARGIDTAAHKGALEAGGQTYVVLGCGLNIAYPPENKTLFAKVEEGGALFSEYPLDTPPLSHHFPIRNRFVAGICDAVIVVEAGIKSGALLTADFALEFGRDVLAVPGYRKSEVSVGANRLIKQGAHLVENANDVLEVLGMDSINLALRHVIKQSEKEFLIGMGWDPISVDELMQNSMLSVAQVSTTLVKLELSGFVRKDISGRYLRIH